MHRERPIVLITFLCTFVIALPQAVQAAKLYRWVDSEGNTHYSDRLPPEEARKARTLLDERGIKLDTVEAARTPEEIAREKELQRMRAERQRLIEQQNAADRVLLQTFRSEDDIQMTLNGKLAAIDVQILVVRSNIKRLKQKLTQMQKDAASLELRGKRISKNFLKEIENTRLALKDSYAAIIRNEKQKEKYREAYQKDLERFLKLKNLRLDQTDVKVTGKRNLILEHLFPCADQQDCDLAWVTAENFVRDFATMKIRMLSDTIIMTAAPVKDDDISITIARIRNKVSNQDGSPNGDSAQLFMDLQCKNSPRGEELCASEKVGKIRDGFKEYMTKNRPANSAPKTGGN